MPRPMPFVPPVTMAVLFLRSIRFSSVSSVVIISNEKLTTEDTEKSLQLFTQPLIHDLRISFPFRSFHYLPDEESEQRFFPCSILFDLVWIRGDYLVNHSIDFAGV